MHSIKSNVQSGQVKLQTHISPRELSEVSSLFDFPVYKSKAYTYPSDEASVHALYPNLIGLLLQNILAE